MLQTLIQSVGRPSPLGATVTETGVNFAVFSPDARSVVLCLFSSDTEEVTHEIVLDNKTGDIWHVHIEEVGPNQHYAYRVDRGEEQLLMAPTDKVLIDPYAKKLNRPVHWCARQYLNDSHFMVPKCVVVDERDYSSARPAKPQIRPEQRIVYETHIKGLTKLHPDVPKSERGRYPGAAHPAVIRHLKQLGVTSVQFMPMASFMPEPYITEKGMTNYWGYNPVNFFAPEPRYACEDALAEIIAMVDSYHEAGLEVIADVVVNHTAEGGKGGPILSFKGFSPYQSYLYEQDDKGRLVFSNHSGCGNTVNTAHPQMMTLIMDALRFWITVIGVDGFRFDLAVSLGREPQHFTPQSGLLRAIRQDPVLSQAVLIAEPWDIGPDGYQLGRFGYDWLEVNDKFRDTVRAFWRGDEGTTADFATRLLGSRDVFPTGFRHQNTSVNNVTYHDGFTLHDLVSYEQRHNYANGEDNRDGHGHNLSANYGHEGATTDPAVLSLREQQKRNLFATLIFSQGTPHVLGGDELSKTQEGNNNAYCQDNELNWYLWDMNKRKQDFLDYCAYVINLRQRSSLLSRLMLEDDNWQCAVNVKAIRWYLPDGSLKDTDDWHAGNKAFGLEIEGLGLHDQPAETWFFCINADTQDVRVNLPQKTAKSGWKLKLDSRYPSINDQPSICVQRVFSQAARSIALFKYSHLSI